ncbi:MAG: hypothetical protein LBD50_03580 [Rickettsiales bacterium]|jgi:hypothetical protein|nr:hypothetical protein [Rickettsiales bacterium]
MTNSSQKQNITDIIAENDRKNLLTIKRAAESGRINVEAADYLTILYSDGMAWFREVFHVLGKCLGAPKAAVMPYDYLNGSAVEKPMKISDINPMSAYMAHHRLDADPMRNQFFSKVDGHKVELSVSSIVSVIIGAQKKIERALDKITGKYYKDYVDEVAATAQRVISASEREASGRAVADKIRQKFSEKFISAASETVLGIIGRGHEKISVDLVRELDKIEKPHLRLKDVWRVKCLFDLIPQARTFIERIRDMSPHKIITIRDKFYDMENPRNYRDAKIILNISRNGDVVPMEIICQVRTLFEFDRKSHDDYEKARKIKSSKQDIEKRLAEIHENGIREYNLMICGCLDDLFDRVGWNILYHQGNPETLFDGFPKISAQYYPARIIDAILNKLDSAVENEVFYVNTAPAKLSRLQEIEIFRWMARFVLISAMPCMNGAQQVPGCGIHEKLFNFIMKELQRYL